MKPKSLLKGQTIHICDHKWDGRSVHDFNNPSSAIHLDKEPNHGLSFHGKIRIPLKGEVSVEVPQEINMNLSRTQLKEVKNQLTQEITEAFSDNNTDKISKDNFIYQIVEILCNDWRDKLKSKERALDVATRLAKVFDLGDEVNQIIKKQQKKIEAYTSIYVSNKKQYYISIKQETIDLGEVSGVKKNKWN